MSKRAMRLPAILRTPIRTDRFPPERRDELVNAALEARLVAVFELYDIPPSDPHRWERLGWIFLGQSFPGFDVQDRAPAGRKNEWSKREKLLTEFEGYSSNQSATAKAASFLRNRAAVCERAGISTAKGLLNTIRLARREREQTRLLVHYGAMEAYGLNWWKKIPA